MPSYYVMVWAFALYIDYAIFVKKLYYASFTIVPFIVYFYYNQFL